MGLGDLLENVVDAFTGHNKDNGAETPNDGNVLPASQDPQGDPASNATNSADQQAGILPASQDPLGDPADTSSQDRQAGIRPASEDPLGDPADQR